MRKIYPALFLVFFMSACGMSSNQKFTEDMNVRIGKMTVDQAIEQWGPPSYERKEGGRTLMAWVRSQYYTPHTPVPAAGGGPYGALARGLAQGMNASATMREIRNTLMIWFNSNGVMEKWKYMRR